MNKHIGRNIVKCDYKNKLILNSDEKITCYCSFIQWKKKQRQTDRVYGMQEKKNERKKESEGGRMLKYFNCCL